MINTSKIIVWLNNNDGSPVNGAVITAKLNRVGETSSGYVTDKITTKNTDSNGYVELDLWRNISPSTYTITATDPSNDDAVIFSYDYVTVGAIDQTINDLVAGNGNAIPSVSFAIQSLYDIVDKSINVTGTASDPDGSIAAYLWTINGVSVGTTATLNYNISDVGEHVVRLIVTDDDGAMRSSSQTVTLFEGSAENSAAISAVETAESTTTQSDFSSAQTLVTALSTSGFRDDLQVRLDVIVVGSLAATDAVVTAEAQQTPENQTAAQTLVTELRSSSIKSSLQSRVDALNAQVANVVAARAAVVGAETYTWLATEQTAAQALVDPLQSSTERTALSARLDALDNKIAAETAVQAAEVGRTDVLITNAQAAINLLASSDQTQIQTRLDAIFVPARIVHSNTSPGSWSNRPPNSPFLAPNGFYARTPGPTTSFSIDREISQGSGWHVIDVFNDEPSVINFVAVGIEAEALATVDLTSSTDRLFIVGDLGFFDSAEVVSSGDADRNFTIAINYQTNPRLYYISNGTVACDVTLQTTSDITLIARATSVAGDRDVWSFRVNTGGDLANDPMTSVQSILSSFGADTSGWSQGWDGTNPGTTIGAATIAITGVSATPTIGVQETLNVSCVDANSVDQSSNVEWYVDGLNWNHPEPSGSQNPFGTGSSFSFTPQQLGSYVVRAVYYDPQGRNVTSTATVFVDGAVSQFASTSFNAAASNSNIADITGNQVRFGTADPFKLAAIANQGMWGFFRYFELTYTTSDVASVFGFGATTLLNGDVMWGGRPAGSFPNDGAGSWSILSQSLGEFPIIWNNGASQAERDSTVGPTVGTNGMNFLPGGGVIGYAIDYLDKNDYPLIYIFMTDSVDGFTKCFGNFRLRHCKSPLYPMVYCNIASSETPGNFDVTVNGGNTAFTHDPRPLMTALGVDLTNFEYGWATAEVQT